MNLTKIITFLVTIWSTTLLAAQVSDVSVDRAWGLLIGDNVVITASLPVVNEQIDESTLPQVDTRYGHWLYLKKLDVNEQLMTFHYQLINVPPTNAKIESPEFSLRVGEEQFITIPAVKLAVGPLLPTDESGNVLHVQPKPDHQPKLLDTSPIKQRLQWAMIISVLLAAILAVWHFGWRPRNRMPFAQAVHDLTRLKWSRSQQHQQAARILHAAFNNTAGTIVVHAELNTMMTLVPWLQPLEGEIRAFFEQSEHHFFSRQQQQEPELASVLKLAKACRAREKLA